MQQQRYVARANGVTLVELMVVIAVLSVIVSIALPAYDRYVREGHFATMRSTLNGLRTVMEDYHLENGDFGGSATYGNPAAIDGQFDWNPSGDLGAYNYTVVVTGTNAYNVWGEFGTGGVWVRCENRFRTCCDSESSASSTPSGACGS